MAVMWLPTTELSSKLPTLEEATKLKFWVEPPKLQLLTHCSEAPSARIAVGFFIY